LGAGVVEKARETANWEDNIVDDAVICGRANEGHNDLNKGAAMVSLGIRIAGNKPTTFAGVLVRKTLLLSYHDITYLENADLASKAWQAGDFASADDGPAKELPAKVPGYRPFAPVPSSRHVHMSGAPGPAKP
jgi:hypothetical protein